MRIHRPPDPAVTYSTLGRRSITAWSKCTSPASLRANRDATDPAPPAYSSSHAAAPDSRPPPACTCVFPSVRPSADNSTSAGPALGADTDHVDRKLLAGERDRRQADRFQPQRRLRPPLHRETCRSECPTAAPATPRARCCPCSPCRRKSARRAAPCPPAATRPLREPRASRSVARPASPDVGCSFHGF